jgi:LemA protein
MKNNSGNVAVFALVFLLIVLAVVAGIIVLNYNGIVSAEKSVEESQAQIATVCQRRLDLLPNLIETVKAYAKHEKETLTAVVTARAQASSALTQLQSGAEKATLSQVATTQMGLTKAMRGLFALVENYPNLRASSNFMALQDQFEGTENRIAVARQRYNSAVRFYNTKIETFPGVFIAPMFGFGEKEFYDVQEEAAYQPVKAEF